MILSDLLASKGYSPVLAGSSVEALGLFSRDPPFATVLLNLTLRSPVNLKLLERLKAIQPETPVIVLSSSQEISLVVSAIKKGAFDYLPRPVDRDPLLETLRSAIEHRATCRKSGLDRQNLEQVIEARTEMLRNAVADLERSYDITLEALGNALDLKDAETEGHSKRVTAYTIVLARAMHLRPAEVKVVARGAYLHDIGKMAIPDAILSKPGKLTPQEQAIMREHCVLGYMMLKKIPFLREASEIVFSHQEHYDGSGYSRGLKGEEIVLGARIFSIADALDAITSDRPYRKARSFGEARQEIDRCTGTQFDPAVVAVYRSLPDQLWEDVRAEIKKPKETLLMDLAEDLGDQKGGFR